MSDITWSAAQNPRWLNSANTLMDLDVNFDHVEYETWSPCTLVASGDLPHIHDLFARAVAGEFGAVQDYVRPDDLSGSDGMTALRTRRDELLAETDHWALQDTPAMTTEQINYRQALRDLPANSPNATLRFNDTDLDWTDWVNVTWPVKP